MVDKKVFMKEDDFRGLCKAVYPLLHKVTEELEKYGVPDMATISLSKDGYINLSAHGTGWSLIRTKRESDARMRHDYQEPILPGEETNHDDV